MPGARPTGLGCMACAKHPVAAHGLCKRCTARVNWRGYAVGPDLPRRPTRAPKHGKGMYSHGCRCEVCVAAIRHTKKAWKERNPEVTRLERRKAHDKTVSEWQRATSALAVRHRYVWTGPELDLLLREDLTAREIALRLGRSWHAVATMRGRVRSEPKLRRVVGLDAMR